MASPSPPPRLSLSLFPAVILTDWEVEFVLSDNLSLNGLGQGQLLVHCKSLTTVGNIDLAVPPHVARQTVRAVPGVYEFVLEWLPVQQNGLAPPLRSSTRATLVVTKEIHAAIWWFLRNEAELSLRAPQRAATLLDLLRVAYDQWRKSTPSPADDWPLKWLFDDPEPQYGGPNAYPDFDQELARQREVVLLLEGEFKRYTKIDQLHDKRGIPRNDEWEMQGDVLTNFLNANGYIIRTASLETWRSLLAVTVRNRLKDKRRKEKPEKYVSFEDSQDGQVARSPEENYDTDFSAFLRYLALERCQKNESIFQEPQKAAVDVLYDALLYPLAKSDLRDARDKLRIWVAEQGRRLRKREQSRATRANQTLPSDPEKLEPLSSDDLRKLVADALRFGQSLHLPLLQGCVYYRVAVAQLTQMERVLKALHRKPVPDPEVKLAVGVGSCLDEADRFKVVGQGDELRSGSLFRRFVYLFPALHYLSECARWVMRLDEVGWPDGVLHWDGFTTLPLLDSLVNAVHDESHKLNELLDRTPPRVQPPLQYPQDLGVVLVELLCHWGELQRGRDFDGQTPKQVAQFEEWSLKCRAATLGLLGEEEFKQLAQSVIRPARRLDQTSAVEKPQAQSSL